MTRTILPFALILAVVITIVVVMTPACRPDFECAQSSKVYDSGGLDGTGPTQMAICDP